MRKLLFIGLCIILSFFNLKAQETISSGSLSITIENVNNGVTLNNITNNGIEVLNEQGDSFIFQMLLRNTATREEVELTSINGWGSVEILNNGASCIITLKNPESSILNSSLTAIITIETNNDKSSWDMSIAGLGNATLLEVDFPILNFKAEGDDDFLVPYFHGQLTHNPANELDYYNDPNDARDNLIGLYPRGFGATMQFMAYYNESYGLYFGFHDALASLKQLQARNMNDGVEVSCKYSIPDMTLAGNDWELPGVFQLDLFNGDWFDASLHYKQWVSEEANYWPQESPQRSMRQQELGRIGLWIYNYLSDASGNLNTHRGLLHEVANFVETPLGVHWYEWNYLKLDDDYPLYFPERDGLMNLVDNTQGTNYDISIMPYVNGRLFDQDIAIYNTEGFPDATKHEDGTVFRQRFNNNNFAVMCPVQERWQETLLDAVDQLTERIGTAGIYVDQVGAASPARCMDPNHNHPLGGGSYWSDGYQEMFSKFHNGIGESKYITTESGCDFLANEVDGFMIQGWVSNDLVPAFSAVYSSKVQLFGIETGTSQYGNQRFYGKLARAFTFGVQPGRQSMWLYLNLANANDDKLMAANYTKSLGQMRSRLKEYLSFGEMQRPISLNGAIPILNYSVLDGTLKDVIMPAIQSSIWKNGDSLIVLFANARLQSPAGVPGGNIDFSFDFDASQYGLSGDLIIQEIHPTSQGVVFEASNSFTRNVSLPNLDVIAFKIKMANLTAITQVEKPHFNVFPNPSEDRIAVETDLRNFRVELLDITGRKLYSRNNILKSSFDIDISELESGVYFLSINGSSKTFVKK